MALSHHRDGDGEVHTCPMKSARVGAALGLGAWIMFKSIPRCSGIGTHPTPPKARHRGPMPPAALSGYGQRYSRPVALSASPQAPQAPHPPDTPSASCTSCCWLQALPLIRMLLTAFNCWLQLREEQELVVSTKRYLGGHW